MRDREYQLLEMRRQAEKDRDDARARCVELEAQRDEARAVARQYWEEYCRSDGDAEKWPWLRGKKR